VTNIAIIVEKYDKNAELLFNVDDWDVLVEKVISLRLSVL
jgi:hypothetical protein